MGEVRIELSDRIGLTGDIAVKRKSIRKPEFALYIVYQQTLFSPDNVRAVFRKKIYL